MHCPRCNALNPDDAKFCSLCLAKLNEPTSHPDVEQIPSGRLPDAGPETQRAWDVAGRIPSTPESVASGPIKKTDQGVNWSCPRCDTENPIESNRCRVCGSTIFDAFRPPEAESVPSNRDPKIASLLSAVPGVGHLYLGYPSEGITRLLLAAWWLGTGLLLPTLTPILLGTKVIFMVAFIGLSGLSVFDAYRLAEDPGSVALLDRRMIFFGSLGLFILTVVALISTGVALRG